MRGLWKASETSYCVRQGWDTNREVLSDHFNREARILEMPESHGTFATEFHMWRRIVVSMRKKPTPLKC